jgi:gas vesicle protein
MFSIFLFLRFLPFYLYFDEKVKNSVKPVKNSSPLSAYLLHWNQIKPNTNPMKLGRLLAGIVSGVTFGVLFAPKEGKKLRKELKKGKGDVKALGKAFKHAGKDALEEIKKLSKHDQVVAFLEMSEQRVKEIASNLDENNSEMIQSAKEKLEAISAFALEKAADLKEALSDEEQSGKKKKPTAKKRTSKASAKKKPAAKKKTTSKKMKSTPKKKAPAKKKTLTKKAKTTTKKK